MALAKETRWERYDRLRYLQSNAEDMIEVELEEALALEGDRDMHGWIGGISFLSYEP
jgi:hypothetical protein